MDTENAFDREHFLLNVWLYRSNAEYRQRLVTLLKYLSLPYVEINRLIDRSSDDTLRLAVFHCLALKSASSIHGGQTAPRKGKERK